MFCLALPTCVLALVEYFLAKLESPWPGRILPILSVFYSVCLALIIALNVVPASEMGIPAALLVALVFLLVFNLPTAVFLIVYRNTRKKYVDRKNMDRMNIQDL